MSALRVGLAQMPQVAHCTSSRTVAGQMDTCLPPGVMNGLVVPVGTTTSILNFSLAGPSVPKTRLGRSTKNFKTTGDQLDTNRQGYVTNKLQSGNDAVLATQSVIGL